VVVVGTVTSAAAFFVVLGAAAAFSVFGEVFFSAGIVFTLLVDLVAGISNAVGMLTYILTCLNHIL
jgi:hypothetical protein